MRRSALQIRAAVVAALAAVLVVAASGCERTEPTEAERAEVVAVAERYLETLAEAYDRMDPGVLRDVATGGEMAAVDRLLRQLDEGGDRIRVELRDVDVEDVRIFRGSQAKVELVERWHVTRLDRDSGAVTGENPSTVQHTVLNLMDVDGAWKVSSRQVTETEGASAWTFPTPDAGGGEGAEGGDPAP